MDEKENMRTIGKNEIVIDIDDYDELQERSTYLGMFFSSMMNHSHLGYDDKSIRFDDEELATILSMMSPNAYLDRIRFLQEQKKAKEKEKENGVDKS